jgi:hypothetical protein
MDWNSIWTFLTTPGNGERIAGLIFAFLGVLAIAGVFIGYMWSVFFDFLRSLIGSFKRKEKIVKVTEYLTPPENKEIDKYLTILKKIADDYNTKIQL